MLAVIQRVTQAFVSVPSHQHEVNIGHGLCVLLCAEQGDTEHEAAWMAGKIARLRIFRDDDDRMNRSVQDMAGEILLVSQFTLAGDCRKGNRPSFVSAADPAVGEALYEKVGEMLRTEHQLPVRTGVFGGMMQVTLTNDGPVTIILRTPKD